MAVTDLLTRFPFPPPTHGEGADALPEAEHEGERPSGGDGAARTLGIEFPVGLRIPTPPASVPRPPASSEPAEDALRSAGSAPPAARPLPRLAIALLGGLALVCLALTVALVAALSTAPASAPIPVDPTDEREAPPATTATRPAEATPAAFPAAPLPLPVDLITQLEAASGEPIEGELTLLLGAIQQGFGTQSARLEPTLRSYVYRLGSRFEWTPGTFRVAVTAPSPGLAAARSALLADLFEDAVAAGRLQIGSGTGPHALTLVTE